MIFSGIVTAIGLVAITAKFSKTFLQKLLGYDWAVDLIVTLGLPIVFMGTYVGMMTAVITGLCVSLILWITKNVIGYQKYVLVTDENDESHREWKYYDGAWTVKSIANSMSNAIKSDISSVLNEFKQGWNGNGQAKVAT